MSNGTKLKADLLHDALVFFRFQLITGRRYVNQSAQQTRLGVRDFNRTICAHKQETLETILIRRFEFFVHTHELVRNKAIQSSVVLDFRQVAIMLYGNKRVVFKRLQRKLTTG